MNHCINEPDGKVKQIRYCDNPLPRFGGDLCPEPDHNERYISCNDTNYQGIIYIIFKFQELCFDKEHMDRDLSMKS